MNTPSTGSLFRWDENPSESPISTQQELESTVNITPIDLHLYSCPPFPVLSDSGADTWIEAEAVQENQGFFYTQETTEFCKTDATGSKYRIFC